MDFRSTVQTASLVIAISGLFGWAWWRRLFDDRKSIGFAPIWYLFQIIVYYSVIIPGYTFWGLSSGDLSAVLRLEGVIILSSSAFIMIYFRRRRQGAEWNGKQSSSPS